MGSFTIWHLGIVAILIGAIYGIYRFAKQNPPASYGEAGPVGVGGWLLLLVLSFIFIGPIFGAARLNFDFMNFESQFPQVLTAPEWSLYKSATWGCYAVASLLSIYAGLGLARGRNISVVKQAKIIIWIVGPGVSIVMGLLIPLVVLGSVEYDPEFLGGLIGSAIGPIIWTIYLSKSRRVKATYTLASARDSVET